MWAQPLFYIVTFPKETLIVSINRVDSPLFSFEALLKQKKEHLQ